MGLMLPSVELKNKREEMKKIFAYIFALAAFAIALAIIVTVLTLLLAIALASLVVGVAGILGFVVSFGVLASADFATAFTLMGVSLFMIAVGALLAIPGWAIILKVVPAFFRGLVKLFKKIFRIK